MYGDCNIYGKQNTLKLLFKRGLKLLQQRKGFIVVGCDMLLSKELNKLEG